MYAYIHIRVYPLNTQTTVSKNRENSAYKV